MKNLLLILSFISIGIMGNAQFCIPVSPEDTTYVCPGDSVLISANTPGALDYDFDNGALPSDWSLTGTSFFSQPCGPGIDTTAYYWAATSAATPQITTADLNVSCGGVITFDMKYAVQSGSSPCEGPDLANEGVELQYSVNGGVTWIPIVYYSPGGYELPSNPFTTGSVASGTTPYTSWSNFTTAIPAGALSGSTRFRWIQEVSSGTCCDNWGIDNIYIDADECPIGYVDWDGDALEDSLSFWHVVTADTFFVADAYDTTGFYYCSSDTIWINLYQNTMTFDLVDTVFAYCPTDSIPVEVTNVQFAPGPYSYQWSTGATTADEILGTNGNKWDTITYSVDVTDVCGYVSSQDVIMVVNQLLMIDTLIQYPTNACSNTGAVSAFPVGIVDTSGYLAFYHWDDQANYNNNGSGSFYDASVWPDLSSGWYYFTISDDLCSETDSVFVEMDNPPMADFSASTTQGCSPLDVTFTNNSENTDMFYWDFDNGNSFTVNNMNDQDQTFTNTSTVMLVASTSADPSCADTAYVTITVAPCGCTDPNATNYNPAATIDDGSCILPIPTVIVPNVITPNGDEVNDIFELTVTNSTEIELTILNRWGNVIFNEVGTNPGWDGKTQGGLEVEAGTYFYRYIVKGVDENATLEGQGFLQLLRD